MGCNGTVAVVLSDLFVRLFVCWVVCGFIASHCFSFAIHLHGHLAVILIIKVMQACYRPGCMIVYRVDECFIPVHKCNEYNLTTVMNSTRLIIT